MRQIITIGREFGSGGREIGRRLAEKLQIAYYDREIVSELAKRTHFTEEYIQRVEESSAIPLLPITIGRTFLPQFHPVLEQSINIFAEQNNFIKEIAVKSDCVIVGRSADYILREMKPFRVFIYADLSFKLSRCREKGMDLDGVNDKELKQRILSVDKQRARYYQLFSDQSWGDKSFYDLCINTTNIDVKKAADIISDYLKRLS